MSDTIATPWPRPYWQPATDGSAPTVMLQYYVFGRFEPNFTIPVSRYGVDGLPKGVTLERFQNAVLRHWDGYPLAGDVGRLLREEQPDTYEAARQAADVLVIRGELADGDTLDYLRDTIGTISALLDAGGTCVVDPQTVTLYDARAWRDAFVATRSNPTIRPHLLILRDESESGVRVRTRGMRKFARPDIAVEAVPDAHADQAGMLCERLAEVAALGARLAPDAPLAIEGLPFELVGKLDADTTHAAFGNAHITFRWPG